MRTKVNQLIDQMATLLLAEAVAETHFLLRAQRGRDQQARGLELMAKARGGESEDAR